MQSESAFFKASFLPLSGRGWGVGGSIPTGKEKTQDPIWFISRVVTAHTALDFISTVFLQPGRCDKVVYSHQRPTKMAPQEGKSSVSFGPFHWRSSNLVPNRARAPHTHTHTTHPPTHTCRQTHPHTHSPPTHYTPTHPHTQTHTHTGCATRLVRVELPSSPEVGELLLKMVRLSLLCHRSSLVSQFESGTPQAVHVSFVLLLLRTLFNRFGAMAVLYLDTGWRCLLTTFWIQWRVLNCPLLM